MTNKYKLIDHTADVGIHVFGTNANGLFANAALAMFDQIADMNAVKGTDAMDVRVTGEDWPDLMVNWLRELLFLWTGREMLVKDAEILSLSEYELIARVRVDPYDPVRHTVTTEIKAVTYHGIQVNRSSSGWDATIIFDV